MAWRQRSTLLASAEKSGKSTLIGYVAAQVSLGGEFLGEPCEQGPVLIFGFEEFIGDTARRLRHFQADPKQIHIVDQVPADPQERPQALEAHINAVKPVLVLVDTLAAYWDGIVSDAASSSQVQPIVQRLTRISHEADVALVLVHHTRKSDGRYRDSTAIGGGVDVIIEVSAPDENTDPTLRKAAAKGRVPVHNYRFRFDGRQYVLDSGALLPLDQRILNEIRSRPGISARDVRESVSGRIEDINRLLMQMLADGRVSDSGNVKQRKLYVAVARQGDWTNNAIPDA
jgi:hypothetical protein